MQETSKKHLFKAPLFIFSCYRDPDYNEGTVKMEYSFEDRTRSKKVTFQEALQLERDLLKRTDATERRALDNATTDEAIRQAHSNSSERSSFVKLDEFFLGFFIYALSDEPIKKGGQDYAQNFLSKFVDDVLW